MNGNWLNSSCKEVFEIEKAIDKAIRTCDYSEKDMAEARKIFQDIRKMVNPIDAMIKKIRALKPKMKNLDVPFDYVVELEGLAQTLTFAYGKVNAEIDNIRM